jgi:N-acetylmuramoyl-L-alanine amidase
LKYKIIGIAAICASMVASATSGLTLGPNEAKVNFENEIECLAKNIYFESANQPFAGKLAVGMVTLNRVDSEDFPNTVCDVVYQARMKPSWKTGEPVPIRNQCQFSWYCDGKPDDPYDTEVWHRSIDIAMNLYTIFVDKEVIMDDITEGATFYHATYVSPRWRHSLKKTVQIEDHIFYKDE